MNGEHGSQSGHSRLFKTAHENTWRCTLDVRIGEPTQMRRFTRELASQPRNGTLRMSRLPAIRTARPPGWRRRPLEWAAEVTIGLESRSGYRNRQREFRKSLRCLARVNAL